MSLETCDDGHEMVVWEGSGYKKCPICAQLAEASNLLTEKEDEIRKLNGEIEELEEANGELEEKLEAANAWAKERFAKSESPERVVPKPKGEL